MLVNIIYRQWLLSLTVFIVSFVGVIYLRGITNRPVYQASGQLLLKSPSVNLQIESQPEMTLSNEVFFIQSESLAEKVLQDLGYPMSKKDLQKNLNVSKLQGANIIELSFVSENPQQATAVVNTWLENYIKFDQENNQGENQSISEFLAKELPKSQKNLDLATKKLKNFQQRNQLIDVSIEASSAMKAIREFKTKIVSLQAQQKSLTAQKKSLQNIIQIEPQKAIMASVIIESPLASSLLTQLQDIKVKLKQQQVNFNDQHPEIIILSQQEQILRQQLQDYLAETSTPNQIKNIQPIDLEQIYQLGKTQQKLLWEYASTEREIEEITGEIESLTKLIVDYQERLDNLRDLEFEQKQLQRDLSTQEQVVQNLTTNYQDIQLAASRSQGNIKSVQFATVPELPISLSFTAHLIQAAIMAIFISLLTSIIVDRFEYKNKVE